MAKLLEQAIAQIRELPEELQEAVAGNLIYLIENVLNGDEDREFSADR